MNQYNLAEPARRGSYMGDSDQEVWQWALNFADRMDAFGGAYGLTPADAAAIRAVTDQYLAAYALVTEPTTNSTAATIAKNSARAELERVCRPFAMQIKARPSVSDELKVRAGIHVDDRHRTPVRVPRTRPVLSVVQVDWTGFVVRFRDSALVESRGKPKGAIGMLLLADFATPGVPATHGERAVFPDGARSLAHVAMLTRSPQRVSFPPEVMRGRAARYCGCWMNARGKCGPCSSPLFVPTFSGTAHVPAQPPGDALKLAG